MSGIQQNLFWSASTPPGGARWRKRSKFYFHFRAYFYISIESSWQVEFNNINFGVFWHHLVALGGRKRQVYFPLRTYFYISIATEKKDINECNWEGLVHACCDISSPAKRGLLPWDREVKWINDTFFLFSNFWTSPVAISARQNWNQKEKKRATDSYRKKIYFTLKYLKKF